MSLTTLIQVQKLNRVSVSSVKLISLTSTSASAGERNAGLKKKEKVQTQPVGASNQLVLYSLTRGNPTHVLSDRMVFRVKAQLFRLGPSLESFVCSRRGAEEAWAVCAAHTTQTLDWGRSVTKPGMDFCLAWTSCAGQGEEVCWEPADRKHSSDCVIM